MEFQELFKTKMQFMLNNEYYLTTNQYLYLPWLYIWVTRRGFIRSSSCLPFASTWVHPVLLSGVRVAYMFCLLFFVLSYYVSIRAEFHVVMYVTIFAYKLCSVRLYLQLFVGGLVSYLQLFTLFPFVCI
jgi:hypothetical protein